jgi:hypothetical protein
MWALMQNLNALGSLIAFNFAGLGRVLIAASQSKWAAMLALVLFVWTVVNYGATVLVTAVATVVALVLPTFDVVIPPGAIDAAKFANTIVPVGETLVFTALYGVELVIMTVYRHLKTMVPGVLPGGGGA